jgi:Protein of unknown function (DUF1361)
MYPSVSEYSAAHCESQAIPLDHPVATLQSMVTLPAKRTVHSDGHTALNSRVSRSRLVRSGALLSCAGTGLLVGYLSLIDVQGIVARSFGAACGWIFALFSLVLSGFAIYLGRFLRWNSWDVLIAPARVFEIIGGLMEPWAHARAVAVTLIFGGILTLGYISLRILLAHPERS